MNRITCFLLFALQIIVLPVFSQHKVWTIKACIDTAIKNNLSAQLTKSTQDNSTEVDLDGVNKGQAFIPVNFTNLDQQQNVYSLQANLEALETSATSNKDQLNQLDFESAKSQLTFKVLDAYLKVLFDLEQIDLLNKQILASRQQLLQAEDLVKQGKQSKHQLLQIELQLGNDKMSLINAVGDLSYDQITLMQVINVPLAVDFEIQKISSSVLEDLLKRPSGVFLIQSEALQNNNLAIQKTKSKSEQQLEQKKRVALRKAIDQVYAEMDELQKKYEFAQNQFALAESSYKNLQSDFEGGLVTAMDLELEKHNFLDAQSKLLQAKYQLILNKEKLELYQKGSISL